MANKPIILLPLVALLVLLLMFWQAKDLAQVCFTVTTSEPGKTSVVWDTGEGFLESNLDWQWTHFNGVDHRYCFTSWVGDRPIGVRVDPVEQPVDFGFEGVTFANPGSFWPFTNSTMPEVSVDQYVSVNNMIPIDDRSWRSEGVDPWILFTVPTTHYPWFGLFLLAGFAVGLVFAGSIAIIRLSARVSGQMLLISTALGAIFWFWVSINREFINGGAVLFWLMPGIIGIYVAALLLFLKTQLSPKRLSYSLVFVCSIGLLLGDAAFRLGLLNKPPFMLSDNHTYHWSLPRLSNRAPEPYEAYQSDLAALEELLLPETAFFADTATSYYLPAHLSMFPLNVHAHHSLRAAYYKRLYVRICSGDTGVPIELLERSQARQQNDQPPIRYVIYNRNFQDSNVGTSCPEANVSDALHSAGYELPIYDGDWLKVYQIAP